MDCPVCCNCFTIEELPAHVEDCLSTEEVKCPLCGQSDFKDMNLEEHVNKCLDEPKENVDPNRVIDRKRKISSQTIDLTEVAQDPPMIADKPVVRKERKKKSKDVQTNKTKKENTEAPNEEKIKHQTSTESGPKPPPFYKLLPHTKFSIDAFSYGKINDCSAYFLTHFHSDHYTKLNSKFTHGPIYCSPITASLIQSQLKVDKDYVRPLELNKAHEIDGVKVVFIDANHCPGAVLIYFEIPVDKRVVKVLHTGDFRACEFHWNHELLQQELDIVYLDTTYCNPKHQFPSQDTVLRIMAELGSRLQKERVVDIFAPTNSIIKYFKRIKTTTEKTLVVVGTYLIGKEKVVKAIATGMNSLVFSNERKRKILDQLQDEEIDKLLTDDPMKASVHIVSMGDLNPASLEMILGRYSQFNHVLAIRPTGWTFKSHPTDLQLKDTKPNFVNSKITMLGIPYSEHSSYGELKELISRLKVKKIIPTVSVMNHKAFQGIFKQWNKALLD